MKNLLFWTFWKMLFLGIFNGVKKCSRYVKRKEKKTNTFPITKWYDIYVCLCVWLCVCYVKGYQDVNNLTVILSECWELRQFLFSFLCFSVFSKTAIIKFSTWSGKNLIGKEKSVLGKAPQVTMKNLKQKAYLLCEVLYTHLRYHVCPYNRAGVDVSVLVF